jgi:dienelactone hydrolase
MNVLDGEVFPEVIMAVSFECEGCGKEYTVRDEFAGKTGQCKQCGQKMTIPLGRDSDGYGLQTPPAAPEPEEIPDSAMLPPKRSGWATKPASSLGSSSEFAPPKPLSSSSKEKQGSFSFGNNKIGGAIAGLVVVLMIVARGYFKWERAQARNARNNGQQNAMGPQNNANPLAFDRSGPIRLPNFPGIGPGREIEPGITFHEIKLGPARRPLGSIPGHGGKLWLYLPSGEHEAKSLPCILITGAGSTILTGMDLADEDRAEHLPYVRAGFAVLAFELDGVPQNKQKPSNEDMGESMFKFLNARSGLVNAHIALEYVLAKVPQVDPSRISAAGHSSAGTLAVLFAEHEPRLKTCVAFAPALDLEDRFGAESVAQFKNLGVGDLAVRYSPKNNEDKLKAPLFLFHAEDDGNISVEMSKTFANDLKVKGKSITLDIVPSGNHCDSMINEGIPHAIAWLNEQGAGPNR